VLTLFRPEVIAYRNRDRLAGEILITTPHSYYITTVFFATLLIVAGIIAFNAEYPHIESLRGVILPDRGIVSVTPSRAGTITSISVAEGAVVAPGQLLASIKVDESTQEGASAVDVISAASGIQRKSLSDQIGAIVVGGAAKVQQLKLHAAGIKIEIAQMREQLGLLSELIESAKVDLENARTIAKNGFASRQYVQSSMDTLTQRRLSVSTLQQSISSKEAELKSLLTAITQAEFETKAQVASLNAATAQLDQQAVGIGLSGAYQIRSVIAGSVAHVSSKPGQQIGLQHTLMTIVPSGSVLQAELAVPTSSIGFIRTGQTVRLAIDSFPYQKFGTMEGTVSSIANSAVSKTGERGEVNLFYPVTIALRSQFFNVSSNNIPLKPGMTLGARIVTERRTFFEWLFEPYYAVSKRD
jgi:membrane fusion protein